jgi:hypothetical protein
MTMRISWIAIAMAVAFAGCGDDDENTTPDARRFDAPVTPTFDAPPGATFDAPPAQVPEAPANINADITSSVRMVAGQTYRLQPKAGDVKQVFVRDGATLFIEPGVTVLGAEEGTLIIARGSKIEAVGTAAQPIVFTHDAPVGSREPGRWGGIVILGAAPTNWIAGAAQKFEAFGAAVGAEGEYGGTNPDDDSGTLRYVRIEFAGFEFAAGREYNGLTLCGVGAGTDIEYVQVHRGSDDGVELFGGTVNLKHLVLSQNQDDGFDTDNGWSGKAQFVVIQHINPNTSDPNGYESDNYPTDPAGQFDRTPRTNSKVYNATVIGLKDTTRASYGAILRRGTSGRYYNQIIMNFRTAAVEVRDTQTAAQAPAELLFAGSIFWNNAQDNSNWVMQASNDVFNESTSFGGASTNRNVDPALTDPLNVTDPSFLPMAGSPALSGASPPASGDAPFIEEVSYVGAMGAADWTKTPAEWVDYPEN